MNMIRRIFRSEFVILGIITAVLIAGAFYLFTLSVRSSSVNDNRSWNEYYGPLEEDYVRSVRTVLGDMGYINAGVTFTHITDENLNRTYTLSVHHLRFEGMSEKRKEEIEERLLEMSFEDERSSIIIELT